MTRIYSRTLLAIGLAGVLFASGRVAFIGLTHGASPLAIEYFASPDGGPAHVRKCPYVDWNRTDLIRLPQIRTTDAYSINTIPHASPSRNRMTPNTTC
jgi:hypothetical protein